MFSYTVNENIDFKKIGLSCGLELHQQLNTNKLFCNCNSKLVKDDRKPDFIIKRKLNPVASESGEFDETAKIEKIKNKTFFYYGYKESNCLIETDSQPPLNVNQDALKIAMQISLLTNSFFVSKGYVMRKQVVDGSNVSGFQRTLMISTDGFIDFDFGKVRIDKILLEEDAARAIERKENETIYSLDRLGVPLIELVVWHDIHTPEDVKKVALYLGQLFRSTGKTKRGLGSIRQDINISIKDGARVEIKGCQDLNMIPDIVKREVVRQLNLLKVKDELIKRKINNVFLKEKEVTELFLKNKSKIISKNISDGKKIFAFKLDNFKGILGFQVQENRRVGSELASILKASTSLKGIFHSDELPNYGIEVEDVKNISKNLDLKENDAFILIMCFEKEILFVENILEKRLNLLSKEIPKETRVVNLEGNTEYQRPLSGAARMYPETDLKPIIFTESLISDVKKELPLTIKEREDFYINKYKLNTQITNKMKLSNFAPIFEKIVEKTNTNPTALAVFLLEDLIKASRDSLIDLDDVKDDLLFNFFSQVNVFEKIQKDKIIDLFINYLENTNDLKDIIKNYEVKEIDLSFIKNEILNIILDNKEFVLKQRERSTGLIMGKILSKISDVDKKELSNIVQEEIINFLDKNKSF
jgi:glutamyl-tRNA(Gln) amidotransferase subunit E